MIKSYILIFINCIFFSSVFSQAKFVSKSNGGGNWNGGLAVWSITGSDGDNVPDQNDTIEILFGDNITALSSQSTRICKIINNGELTLNSTYPLYIYGNGTSSEINGLVTHK